MLVAELSAADVSVVADAGRLRRGPEPAAAPAAQ